MKTITCLLVCFIMLLNVIYIGHITPNKQADGDEIVENKSVDESSGQDYYYRKEEDKRSGFAGISSCSISDSGTVAIAHNNNTINIYDINGAFLYSMVTGMVPSVKYVGEELFIRPKGGDVLQINEFGEIVTVHNDDDFDWRSIENEIYNDNESEFKHGGFLSYYKISAKVNGEKVVYERGGFFLMIAELIAIPLVVFLGYCAIKMRAYFFNSSDEDLDKTKLV